MKKSVFSLHELGDIADRTLTEELSQRGQKRGKGLTADVAGVSTRKGKGKAGRQSGKRDERIDEIRRKIATGFYSSAEALRKIADKIADDVSDETTQ